MSLMIYVHFFRKQNWAWNNGWVWSRLYHDTTFCLFLVSGLNHEVTREHHSWSICSLLLFSCNLLNTNTYAVGSAWTLGMLTTSWTSEQRTKTMVKLPLSVNTTPWTVKKKVGISSNAFEQSVCMARAVSERHVVSRCGDIPWSGRTPICRLVVTSYGAAWKVQWLKFR